MDVKYSKFIAAVILLWAGTFSFSEAQVIDDSTKAIYGSATVKVIYERDIFKGDTVFSPIDTLLTNMQVVRHWYYDKTLQQDLGNVGTAAQPLFWKMPLILGSRLGRNAFDAYAVNPATIEYYDTKSPFTYLNYLQGTLGEQVFRAKHTRNISPNWNVGIGYERLSAERQFGAFRIGQDGFLSHYGLQAFTHYFSPNQRYRLVANFAQTSHEQIELGGIRPKPGDTRDSLFDYKDESVWLEQAASEEKRYQLHATQWLRLIGSGLQLYHTLDYGSQSNDFSENGIPYQSIENSKRRELIFYPSVLRDSAQTEDNTYFRQMENTFGVMGATRLFVYRAYAKRRDGRYETQARDAILIPITRNGLPADSAGYEQDKSTLDIADNFVGGQAQFRLRNDIYVTTDAEFQIGGGDYRINAEAKYKYLAFRQTRTSYSPTLTQRRLLSNHFEWSNSFKNVSVNQTAATAEATVKNHYFFAELQFSNIRDYVFYQDSIGGKWAEPEQVSGAINLVQGVLRHKFNLKHFVFDNTLYYNSSSGPKAIRMPEWYVNAKAYWEGPLFKKAIFLQTGLEMNWHTDYYADGYMPVTQQFHLQNSFLITRYPTFDVFLNTDIKTVNLFLKLSHINNITSGWEQGYFTTPYYAANPFSFQFGVKWNFYD
nr:putative porin [Rufibacter quisquiliarum]